MVRLVLVLVLFSLLVPEVLAETPLFVRAAPVLVGLGSGQVTFADLNGDGHLDLVTRHPSYRMVRFQYGDGTGKFRPAQTLPLFFSYSISEIEIADFNRDGFADIAALRNNLESVAVLLGNGKGGWTPTAGSPFMTHTAPLDRTKPALAVFDVNADGSLDLLTTNGRRNTFAVLLNDGHGSFVRGPVTSLPADAAYYSTAFGDLDGDHSLDAVTALEENANRSARLLLQRGDGTGAFQPATPIPVEVLPEARIAAVGDVNGDALPDLVLTHATNHLSVLIQQSDDRFVHASGSPFLLHDPAFAAHIADVDHDQKPDLLVTTVRSRTASFPGSLAVLLGQDNTFLPAPGSPFATGNGSYNLTVGDINQDGSLDVATSSFEGYSIPILMGTRQ